MFYSVSSGVNIDLIELQWMKPCYNAFEGLVSGDSLDDRVHLQSKMVRWSFHSVP